MRQLLKQRWWWQLHDKEELDGMNFIWTMWRKNDILKMLQHKGEELSITTEQAPREPSLNKIYSKIEDNFHLSNKKALFLNMKLYYEAQGRDVFSVLPVTFHIKKGEHDPEFHKFAEYYAGEEARRQRDPSHHNIWIIKPGENTNRGQGI